MDWNSSFVIIQTCVNLTKKLTCLENIRIALGFSYSLMSYIIECSLFIFINILLRLKYLQLYTNKWMNKHFEPILNISIHKFDLYEGESVFFFRVEC